MKITRFQGLLLAAATSLVLAACGGGGGGNGNAGGDANVPPASASASTTGFLAYIASLANGMFDSAEPVDVTMFTLPGDNADTLEPVATAIDL